MSSRSTSTIPTPAGNIARVVNREPIGTRLSR